MLQLVLHLLILHQLGFQLAAVLANLAGLAFGAFATLGFLSQVLGQFLDLQLDLRLGRQQFFDTCFKPGLFSEGTFVHRLLLFLRILQLLAQLRLKLVVVRQLGFQFTLAFGKLGCSLLANFSALNLFGQRFRYPFELLLHVRLGSL